MPACTGSVVVALCGAAFCVPILVRQFALRVARELHKGEPKEQINGGDDDSWAEVVVVGGGHLSVGFRQIHHGDDGDQRGVL